MERAVTDNDIPHWRGKENASPSRSKSEMHLKSPGYTHYGLERQRSMEQKRNRLRTLRVDSQSHLGAVEDDYSSQSSSEDDDEEEPGPQEQRLESHEQRSDSYDPVRLRSHSTSDSEAESDEYHNHDLAEDCMVESNYARSSEELVQRQMRAMELTKRNDPGFENPFPSDRSSSSLVGSAVSSIYSARAHETVRRYIRQLGMFIPGRITKWYIDRAANLTEEVTHMMFTEEFEAAVLFVDISGFSVLAEQLERDSHRSFAAQQLSKEVGGALGGLVKIILEWGGDVIKFAGDAIFSVFSSSAHGNMENAVAAACLAARKMVKFSLSNASTGVQMSVHAGVGAGNVIGLHVGGVLNRWEYAITGDPLRQVTEAERCAGKGEVVVSPEVHAYVDQFTETEYLGETQNYKLLSMLGEELGGTEIRTKRLWDDLRKLDNSALHKIYMHIIPYCPRPVIQSMDSGQGVALADSRMCVTIFIKLIGLPYEQVQDIPRVHSTVRLVQKQMYDFNGATLCRVIIDDKGLTCLWAFGMPPHDIVPGDDYAYRAVLATLNLRKALEMRGLSCSAGITFGSVFCGTVGGAQRSEYTLHGTQVNLAARLMSHPLQTILCDESIYRATQSSIRYGEVVKTEVKGKSHKINVFQPLERLPESHARPAEVVVETVPPPRRKPSLHAANSFKKLAELARRNEEQNPGLRRGSDAMSHTSAGSTHSGHTHNSGHTHSSHGRSSQAASSHRRQSVHSQHSQRSQHSSGRSHHHHQPHHHHHHQHQHQHHHHSHSHHGGPSSEYDAAPTPTSASSCRTNTPPLPTISDEHPVTVTDPPMLQQKSQSSGRTSFFRRSRAQSSGSGGMRREPKRRTSLFGSLRSLASEKACAACGTRAQKRKDVCGQCGSHRWVEADDVDSESSSDGNE